MMLIQLTKDWRLRFYGGYEFNDPNRPKYISLRFLFNSIVYFKYSSEFNNIFHKMYTTDDKSWLKEVEEYKQNLRLELTKEFESHYSDKVESLVNDRDKYIDRCIKYKDVTNDLTSLARSVCKVKLFDMKKLDDL